MKFISTTLLLIALLLSLSVGVCALGNDYTFSTQWWDVVLSNTLINGGSVLSSSVDYIYNANIQYLGPREQFRLTNDYIRFQGISTIFRSGLNQTFPASYSISVPLHINVERRSEMIINLYLFTDSTNTVISSPSIVTPNNSYVPEFTFTYLGNPTISPAPDSPYFGGNCLYLLQFTYENQLSTNMTLDYLDFVVNVYNSGTSSVPSFQGVSLGVITDVSNNVILPTSFVQSIENINNRLVDVYVRVNDMRTTLNELNATAELMKDNSDTTVEQLESIESLIDELSDKLSSSGSVSQQIYQTLTVPSSDVSQAVAQLEETVAQAKEELEEINDTIKTVILPSIDDVDDVVSSDTSQSLDDALGNTDVRSTLSTFFSFEHFSSMLLIMLTIGTVGYILYGKKG